MSTGPSFLNRGESDAIAALLADLDAPPVSRERQRPEDSQTPVANAPGSPKALAFAERPPKSEVPPPLPLPEAFTAAAASPPPFSRKASATFAAFNWRNPAPAPVAHASVSQEPERELAPWLNDEPPVLVTPVPAGRYRLGEFLTAVNWRNAPKPPPLPERLQALIPPPPKPALLEDPDAAAGTRRGRQWSVAEVLGQFAFD